MESTKQLGSMGILKQAFILPCRNHRLMLPVMLLSFLPCSLLLAANYLSIYPLLHNLLIKLYHLSQIKENPNTPQYHHLLLLIKRNAEAFIDTDLIFRIAYFILSTFSMIMIIHASAITYSRSKQPTPYEFMVRNLRIIYTWKGPMLTRVYFTLLTNGYTIMSFCIAAALMLNANGTVSLIAISFAFGLPARILYVYLSMTWMVGVVVSVLEEECCGLKALGKGGEVVKGRRVSGFIVAFVLEVVYAGGYIGVSLLSGHHQMRRWKAIGLVVINMFLLLRVFSLMVFTVFYFECSKKHGQEDLGEVVYEKLSVTDSTIGDEDLP